MKVRSVTLFVFVLCLLPISGWSATFGNVGPGSGGYHSLIDTIRSEAFTCPTDGYAGRLGAYILTYGGDTRAKMALYKQSGEKIAETEEKLLVSAPVVRLQTFDFDNELRVYADSVYYIRAWALDSTAPVPPLFAHIRYSISSTSSIFYEARTYGAWPATVSPVSFGVYKTYQMYCEYRPMGYTRAITRTVVTDAGEVSLGYVDSIHFDIYHLDDLIKSITLGPDTGDIWDTINLPGYYADNLSANKTVYLDNAWKDVHRIEGGDVWPKFVPPVSIDTSICIVWGTVTDVGNSPTVGAAVSLTLSGTNLRDTCNQTPIGYYNKTTTTTYQGYYELPAIRSRCFNRSVNHILSISYGPGGKYEDKRLTVPDSASYRIQ